MQFWNGDYQEESATTFTVAYIEELGGGEWEDVDDWEDLVDDEEEVHKASLWDHNISYNQAELICKEHDVLQWVWSLYTNTHI